MLRRQASHAHLNWKENLSKTLMEVVLTVGRIEDGKVLYSRRGLPQHRTAQRNKFAGMYSWPSLCKCVGIHQ